MKKFSLLPFVFMVANGMNGDRSGMEALSEAASMVREYDERHRIVRVFRCAWVGCGYAFTTKEDRYKHIIDDHGKGSDCICHLPHCSREKEPLCDIRSLRRHLASSIHVKDSEGS